MPPTDQEIADQIAKGMAGGVIGDGSGTLAPEEDPALKAAREKAALAAISQPAPGPPILGAPAIDEARKVKPSGNVISSELQLPPPPAAPALPPPPVYRMVGSKHDDSLIPITKSTLEAIRGDQTEMGRGIGIAGAGAEQATLKKADALSQSAITEEQKAAALQALKDQNMAGYDARQAQIDKVTNEIGDQRVTDRRPIWQKVLNTIGSAAGAFAATRQGTPNFAQQAEQAALAADAEAQKQNTANLRAKMDSLRQGLSDYQTQHGITREDILAAHRAITGAQDKRLQAAEASGLAPQIKGKTIVELAQNKLGIDKGQGQLEASTFIPRHMVQVGGGPAAAPAAAAPAAPKIDLRRAVPIDNKGGIRVFNTPEEASAYKERAIQGDNLKAALLARDEAAELAKAGLNSRFAGDTAADLRAKQAALQEAYKSWRGIKRPGEAADAVALAGVGDPFALVDRHKPYSKAVNDEIEAELAHQAERGMAMHGQGGIVYDKEGGAQVGVLTQPKYDAPNPKAKPDSFTSAVDSGE